MIARIRDAVKVLLGYQLVYPEPEVTEEDVRSELSAMGPVSSVPCALQADDGIACQGVESQTGSKLVMVRVREDEEISSVFLTPAGARAFAAGLLNSADNVDGVAPLLFVPRCPHEAEEPERGE